MQEIKTPIPSQMLNLKDISHTYKTITFKNDKEINLEEFLFHCFSAVLFKRREKLGVV